MILTNGSIANSKVTADTIFHYQVGHFRNQKIVKNGFKTLNKPFLTHWFRRAQSSLGSEVHKKCALLSIAKFERFHEHFFSQKTNYM